MDKHGQIETEENGVTELTIRGARKQKNLLEWLRRRRWGSTRAEAQQISPGLQAPSFASQTAPSGMGLRRSRWGSTRAEVRQTVSP